MISGEKETGLHASSGQSVPPSENQIEPPSEKTTGDDPSITALKAIVLEIDWEISDATMTELILQTERLKTTFRKDKIRYLFLQLLGSVGKYIKIKKATAHPAAIQLLNSVYESLEDVFLTTDMREDEKKSRLLAQVDKFNQLKALIARRRRSSDTAEAACDPDAPSRAFERMA